MNVESTSALRSLSSYAAAHRVSWPRTVSHDASGIADREAGRRTAAAAANRASFANLSGPEGQAIAVGREAAPAGYMRSAPDAYRAEVAARDDSARRQHQGGMPGVDVLA